MTCFWNGIIDSLTPQDRDILGLRRSIYRDLISLLKTKNIKLTTVKWNGNTFSPKEIEEHYTHIKDYNIESARRGYWCSICDPFLALISFLLQVRIVHNYLGKQMIYEPQIPKLRGEKIFSSDRGHFKFKDRKHFQ